MERLKAGWEDTLREREEFSERKIKNLEEQKDKGSLSSLAYFSFSIGLQCCFLYLHTKLLFTTVLEPKLVIAPLC